MARRKKTRSKKYGRRRGRVGAILGKNAIMDVVGIAAGAAVGRIVSQKLQLATLTPTAKSAGTIVLGMFVPKMIKGSFGAALGNGMIASGALGVMQGLGVLGAIDDAIDGFPMVGFSDVGAIEYDNDTMGEANEMYIDDQMAGMDEEEM